MTLCFHRSGLPTVLLCAMMLPVTCVVAAEGEGTQSDGSVSIRLTLVPSSPTASDEPDGDSKAEQVAESSETKATGPTASDKSDAKPKEPAPVAQPAQDDASAKHRAGVSGSLSKSDTNTKSKSSLQSDAATSGSGVLSLSPSAGQLELTGAATGKLAKDPQSTEKKATSIEAIELPLKTAVKPTAPKPVDGATKSFAQPSKAKANADNKTNNKVQAKPPTEQRTGTTASEDEGLHLRDPVSLAPADTLKLQSVPKEATRNSPLAGMAADLGLELSPQQEPKAQAAKEIIASEKNAECPGSPESDAPVQGPQPGDIPLEIVEYPYDAPPAKQSIDDKPRAKSVSVQLSSADEEIKQRIANCLSYFIAHPENIARRGPWALMHATLPLGVEAEIVAGSRRVNAIGWMCHNGICARQRMFQPTRTGFRTNIGPGVQGHEGQFLAILAQSMVGLDYPIQVGRKRYKVSDLVKYEMATCREKSELTFKLIGLSHYLTPDQVWRDSRRRSWNLEKMVAEELAQPVIGAACGGTHRLMGLTYALQRRSMAGKPMTGHWYRAEKYIEDYVAYAMSLQNPDGSFSTEWFEGRGFDPDKERRVQTTGHILEWLIFTLPEEELRSPQIQLAMNFLLDTVGANPSYDWPIGPRGHALRAMTLYNERVFGARPGQVKAFVASQRGAVSRYR